MKVTKAKQKMQQAQSGGDAAALARRAGSFPGNVAQVPNAGAMHTAMAAPHQPAWEQAPLLVRVSLVVANYSASLLALCNPVQKDGLCHVQAVNQMHHGLRLCMHQ